MFSYWKLSQVFSGRRQSRNKSFTYDMWLNNAYLSSGTSKHLYSISHQFPFSKSLINTLFYMHINKALLVKKFLLGFSSVAQSCPTLCDPMNRSTPGLPVHPNSWSLPKLMSIELVMPSSHLILCLPLLPSVPPSIRVFSNESTLCMRWPKYWFHRWA